MYNIYLPAHHHAGLVIETIILSHRLTHMFVKVQFFYNSLLMLKEHSPCFSTAWFQSVLGTLNYLDRVLRCFHRNHMNQTTLTKAVDLIMCRGATVSAVVVFSEHIKMSTFTFYMSARVKNAFLKMVHMPAAVLICGLLY